MENQIIVERIGAINYQDSTTQTLALPRGCVFRELYLHLQGAPTVTAAHNIPANLGRGEAWSLLRDIEIIVNGSNTIRRFSGEQLLMLNYFQSLSAPKRESTYGDGLTANPSFDRVLRIPFWMPFTHNPNRTLLDATRLVSLDLRVTFGNYTNVNSQATGWTTAPTLTLSHEYIAVPDNVSYGPFSTWKQVVTQNAIAGAVNQLPIDLDLGVLFRGVLMNTQNNAGADTTGLITDFRWKSGSATFADISEDILRQRFRSQRSLATYAEAEISASSNFNLDAWYYFDRLSGGAFEDLLNTFGFTDNRLYPDFSGACTFTFIPDVIIPVINSRASQNPAAGGKTRPTPRTQPLYAISSTGV